MGLLGSVWQEQDMVRKSLLILLVVAIVGFGFMGLRDLRPYSQDLDDYLQELFVSNGIDLSQEDFLEPVEDPYLAFAETLNLVPASAQSGDRINMREARRISEQVLAVKDRLYLDGLYGKIDMHEHYYISGNVDLFLRALGCFGISKVVLLPTGLPPDNKFYKLNWAGLMMWAKQYPDQIIPFCTIDEADPHAGELVKEYILEGAKGIKLIGGHPDYYDEPLNSENMYKVYQMAAEYDVPVLIHGSLINLPELDDQLDQVFSDFPGVTFILAHYGNTLMGGIHLDVIAELLDKHPNLYIDLSQGSGITSYYRYLDQYVDTIRDFVTKYQDRILFGSDLILSVFTNDLDWLYDRVRSDIDICQKAELTGEFKMPEGVHQGLDLGKEILRKLYYENPRRVLGL
jgi:predicted TIM-barrel fold metal-dependent hydrolase